jgi:hypothetical protein
MNAAFATITPNFKNDNGCDNKRAVVISSESAVTKASIDGEGFDGPDFDIYGNHAIHIVSY